MQGAFGIPAGSETAVVQDIIAAIVNSVFVQAENVSEAGSKTLRGEINIYIQPQDFSNLLSLSSAAVSIRGGSLPWFAMVTNGWRQCANWWI